MPTPRLPRISAPAFHLGSLPPASPVRPWHLNACRWSVSDTRKGKGMHLQAPSLSAGNIPALTVLLSPALRPPSTPLHPPIGEKIPLTTRPWRPSSSLSSIRNPLRTVPPRSSETPLPRTPVTPQALATELPPSTTGATVTPPDPRLRCGLLEGQLSLLYLCNLCLTRSRSLINEQISVICGSEARAPREDPRELPGLPTWGPGISPVPSLGVQAAQRMLTKESAEATACPPGLPAELPVPGRPSGHCWLSWEPQASDRVATSTTLLLVRKPLGTVAAPQLWSRPSHACLWARGQSQPCQQAQQLGERPLPALDPKRPKGREGEGPGPGGRAGSPVRTDSRDGWKCIQMKGQVQQTGPEGLRNQPAKSWLFRGGNRPCLPSGRHLAWSPESPSCSPVLTPLGEKELTPPERLPCARHSAGRFRTIISFDSSNTNKTWTLFLSLTHGYKTLQLGVLEVLQSL